MVFYHIENINNLSDSEALGIVSTYFALNDADYNCTKCKKRISDTARDLMKGCTTKNEKPVGKWREEITYFTCPVNFYRRDYAMYIDMFRHFESGVLPFNGGLLEQPSKIIEVFSLIESLKIENELDRLEKQKKANKKVKNKWQK